MREEDTVCVGSDGLQYCKICGEAKEAFFPEGGFMGMKKHSRQCACDRKAYEEEQKYFKDKYENGESENAVEYKQRGGEMRMNHTEKTIPVWKKYSLNVSEAAEYYGIGEKRLRQIAGENEGADFILEVGSHIRFKRKLFEDYLDTASTV